MYTQFGSPSAGIYLEGGEHREEHTENSTKYWFPPPEEPTIDHPD